MKKIKDVYFGYLLSLIRGSKTIKEAEEKTIEWWDNETEHNKK